MSKAAVCRACIERAPHRCSACLSLVVAPKPAHRTTTANGVPPSRTAHRLASCYLHNLPVCFLRSL
eukprot:1766759-Pleurochrysis_carterae.AAC.1